MTHPAMVKAKRIAKVALENGWQGKIYPPNDEGVTKLIAFRSDDDESLVMRWRDNQMEHASYQIIGTITGLPCAATALKVIRSQPDILPLFKTYGPEIISKYRHLPFQMDEDADKIILKLIGAQIFWYYQSGNKVYDDVVLPPKRKQVIHIKQVQDRRMLNFVGAHGFRSVMLDSILKVA